MKKLLDVPRRYQGKDRYCHLVCLEMVLAYHGESIPREQLIEDLSQWTERPDSEGSAIYAPTKGYDVEFWLFDSGIIDRSLYQKTEQDKKDFEDVFKRLEASGTTNEYYISKVKLLIDCINAGVKLRTQLPTLNLLTQAVDQGIPCITGVRAATLYLNPMSTTNHSVLVAGYDNENIWVNDPGAKIEKLEDPYPVEKERFMAALIQTGARTFIIKKPKN